jgi:hypothetical protein
MSEASVGVLFASNSAEQSANILAAAAHPVELTARSAPRYRPPRARLVQNCRVATLRQHLSVPFSTPHHPSPPLPNAVKDFCTQSVAKLHVFSPRIQTREPARAARR